MQIFEFDGGVLASLFGGRRSSVVLGLGGGHVDAWVCEVIRFCPCLGIPRLLETLGIECCVGLCD